MNGSNRHDARLVARQRSRADGLQRLNELRRGHDRIDGELRTSAVRLLAHDFHFPRVGRRKRRAFRIPDLADRHLGEGVQPEDRGRPRILERALLDHQRRTALLAGRRALLGRLEDELHGARQLGLHRAQHAGDPELHGGVDIVAARVHHADVLPEVGAPDLRRKRQVRLFGDGKRIHVGADRDDGTRTAAFEQRHHAVARDAGAHLETELAQVVGDERRRLFLAVRELGILMDLVPDFGDRRRYLRRLLIDARERILGGQGSRHDTEERGGEREVLHTPLA